MGFASCFIYNGSHLYGGSLRQWASEGTILKAVIVLSLIFIVWWISYQLPILSPYEIQQVVLNC